MRTLFGIGGSAEAKLQRATFLFTEPSGTMHLYGLDIWLVSDQVELPGVPSVLGQDVLRHWRIVHDPPRSELSAGVHWTDWSFDPLTRRTITPSA